MATSWDDLVLPDSTLADLRLLARWAGARDPSGAPGGPVALFTGPAGTGKTAAAVALAADAGVALVCADHAAATRTGRYLASLCDSAAATGAAVLLDGALVPPGGPQEARAAVAVRNRVRAHPGLVVIEARSADAVHPDLAAEAAVHVRFAPPDAPQRLVLWERALGAGAPSRRDLLDRVAELPFTGRDIRLAADAAAAAAGGAVTAEALLRACRLIGTSHGDGGMP